MTKRSVRAHLKGLIRAVVDGRVEVDAFCSAFDRDLMSLEGSEVDLLSGELEVMESLRRKISWHSPFPDERARIVGYIGDDDVRTTARTALEALDRIARAGHGDREPGTE